MPQIDDYVGQDKAVISPASDADVITPANDTLLARVPKAIHNAGTNGNVAVKFGDASATSVTFYMAQGDVLYIRPTIVMATGTTAGSIVGLY